MTDQTTTLADLIRQVESFRDAREWAQFHSPRNLAAALAVEAAELQRLFLWGDDNMLNIPLLSFKDISEDLADELADVIIFALSMASVTGLDVSKIVARKMEKNAQKYPVEEWRGVARKFG
jgi:NTP pyrophosphatase (non-canonical NTP hydrolase)